MTHTQTTISTAAAPVTAPDPEQIQAVAQALLAMQQDPAVIYLVRLQQAVSLADRDPELKHILSDLLAEFGTQARTRGHEFI